METVGQQLRGLAGGEGVRILGFQSRSPRGVTWGFPNLELE